MLRVIARDRHVYCLDYSIVIIDSAYMQMHQIVSIKHMQFLTVSFASKKAILKICLFA